MEIRNLHLVYQLCQEQCLRILLDLWIGSSPRQILVQRTDGTWDDHPRFFQEAGKQRWRKSQSSEDGNCSLFRVTTPTGRLLPYVVSCSWLVFLSWLPQDWSSIWRKVSKYSHFLSHLSYIVVPSEGLQQEHVIFGYKNAVNIWLSVLRVIKFNYLILGLQRWQAECSSIIDLL